MKRCGAGFDRFRFISGGAKAPILFKPTPMRAAGLREAFICANVFADTRAASAPIGKNGMSYVLENKGYDTIEDYRAMGGASLTSWEPRISCCSNG